MTRLFTAALLLLGLCGPALAASAVHKCVINGAVTFQQDPCPTGGVRKEPSVDRLNVDERKRREAAGAGGDARNRTAPVAPIAPAAPATPTAAGTAPAPVPARATFRCDGRTHCSHMTSCAEARFFLANCPGVKMDGDGDGTPCEMQWCKR